MNDRVAEWQSAIDLGFLWAGRDYAQAETWFRQALVLSQALDDPTLHARSLNRIGNWHLNVEQPHEALRYHREALTIFQELQFYVPSLQKSPCFLHAISVLVHYDNAKRSGYNCNVSRGTIPDASSLLQQRAAGVPSPLRGREECRPHRRCLGDSVPRTPSPGWRLRLHSTSYLDRLREVYYAGAMKQVITAKLKLHTDPSQFAELRATSLAYRDALNHVSRYAYAHGKMSSARALQRDCYAQIRLQYHLPAQMACNVPRQVGATYKGLWTKVKQNAAQRKAGITKKRYKGLDQAPKYLSPTLTYNYKYDYSFKEHQQVSVLTLSGRVIVPYTGYDQHVTLLSRGAHIGAAKLWYDKPKSQFYLLVSLEIEVAEPTPETHQHVIGVDVGQRYLAVTATPKNEATFYSGKAVRAKADHYARLRKRLQKKGTRSATRRLVVISRRERRLKQDANHTISRRIVEAHPHSLIGLEELTHIRERIRRRTHRRKKTGPGLEKVSKKARRANRHASQWAFAELHGYLAYKALEAGSMAVKVDAHYSSQACPMCGYTSKANRPERGLLFVCQNCHYVLHADLVGARNVTLRTLLVRQDWMSTGVLSVRPDVSSDKAKAARRQRYAELRWSSDTSPSRETGRGL